MTKTKQSFFQKLIGKEDQEEEVNYNIDTNINNESFQGQGMPQQFAPNPIGQQQYPLPENVNPSPTQRTEQFVQNEPKESEEWVAEQEGQLTIDVYQTENDIVIKSTIAGVKPENLDVQINNDMVTIKGERRQEEEIKEENYYYQECYWGAFSRSIILPVDVQANKSEATMKNGILTIRLPKADSAQSRKIQVRGY